MFKNIIIPALLFSGLLLTCSPAQQVGQENGQNDELVVKAYDRHVELQWPAVPHADRYEVWVSGDTQQADDYQLRTAIQDTFLLDFNPALASREAFYYKVMALQGEERLSETSPIEVSTRELSDEELMDMVQYYTFRYFWHGAEPNSGMARERYHVDGDYPQNDKHIVTTGGTGFGLFGIIAGMEREWIPREEGVARLNRIVDFLTTADRFHGVWPHWLNGETGEVKPFSEFDDGGDLVESAFLMQGLLAVKAYMNRDDERENKLANKINQLWETMEWDWYTRGGEDVLYWHWSPNHEWKMNFPLRGYDETLITYILAASSPTHPVSAEAYHQGWARGGDIRHDGGAFGYRLPLKHNHAEEYGGPLFWAHYSYLGLNPKGLADRYANYWEHNTNHTLINRAWCVKNPHDYAGYGERLWGLTSSYSPVGYAGHKPGEDLGVISPTAALSSIVYTPEYSMDVMKTLYYEYGEKVFGQYGFYDALSVEEDWYPQRYLAIDQGPIVAMIENHRTGLGWKLFMSHQQIRGGLDKLGFRIRE